VNTSRKQLLQRGLDSLPRIDYPQFAGRNGEELATDEASVWKRVINYRVARYLRPNTILETHKGFGISTAIFKYIRPTAELFDHLLLPYPADTLVLPFIVQYFIIAFFNIVRLYPNRNLKQIVTRHYSLIIIIAVFGVWWNFGETIQLFLDPFWNANRSLPYNNILRNWVIGLDFAWRIAPILLAVIVAVPHWRHIRKLSREKAVSKINKSLDP
jgi:hypothetical protein